MLGYWPAYCTTHSLYSSERKKKKERKMRKRNGKKILFSLHKVP